MTSTLKANGPMDTETLQAPAAVRRLDERALRRPEFQEGEPIVLSDGQAWHFPRPTLGDFYPKLGANGVPTLVQGYDLDAEYDDLVEALIEAEGPAAELTVLATIAYKLLSRNYTLQFNDLRHLLRVKRAGDPDRDANVAMWEAISDLALGRGPKPMGDGSA